MVTKAEREAQEAAQEQVVQGESSADVEGERTSTGQPSTSATSGEAALAAGEYGGVPYGFPEFSLEELREIEGRSTATGPYANQGGWQVPAGGSTVVLQSPKQPVGKVKGTTIVNAGPVDGHIRGYTLDEVRHMIEVLERREKK